jgi:hypothetical protein
MQQNDVFGQQLHSHTVPLFHNDTVLKELPTSSTLKNSNIKKGHTFFNVNATPFVMKKQSKESSSSEPRFSLSSQCTSQQNQSILSPVSGGSSSEPRFSLSPQCTGQQNQSILSPISGGSSSEPRFSLSPQCTGQQNQSILSPISGGSSSEPRFSLSPQCTGQQNQSILSPVSVENIDSLPILNFDADFDFSFGLLNSESTSDESSSDYLMSPPQDAILDNSHSSNDLIFPLCFDNVFNDVFLDYSNSSSSNDQKDNTQPLNNSDSK